MRCTEWLPASRLLLGLVPHPAGVTPRAGAGDRGRLKKMPNTIITPPDGPDHGKIQKLLLDLVSKIPHSDVEPSTDPLAKAQAIAQRAALKAAVTSGTLALPAGPLGMATILPELPAIWQIQKQMVADIAATYGKTVMLTREMVVFCLFKHCAAMLVRDIVVRVGGRLLIRRVALRVLQQALQSIGIRITQRVIGQAISRYIPFVGALAVGSYAYYDTTQVAATAIDTFSREIDIQDDDSK